MDKFYKNIDSDYITSISINWGSVEITEKEYREILSLVRNSPSATNGYTYKLKADTLTWELVELPDSPELDDEATESDYIEALQDLGVTLDA